MASRHVPAPAGGYMARKATPEERAAKEAAALAAREAARTRLSQTGAGHGITGVVHVTTAVTDNTLKIVAGRVGAASAAGAGAGLAAAPAGDDLPPGWATAKDGAGKTYYYHSGSNAVQWDRPVAAAATAAAAPAQATAPAQASSSSSSAAAAALPAGWFASKDATGGTYFYTADGRTQWETPTQPAVAAPPAATPVVASTTGEAALKLRAAPGGIGPAVPAALAAAAAAASSSSAPAPSSSTTSSGASAAGRGGFKPFAPRSVGAPGRGGSRGGGGGGRGGGSGGGFRGGFCGGGGHHQRHRPPPSGGTGGAIDPLDPTGTGGKWSDGLAEAQGRKSDSSGAAGAGGAASGGGGGGGGPLPSPGDILRMRAATAAAAGDGGDGATALAGAKRPREG
jgi:hypothetical protein